MLRQYDTEEEDRNIDSKIPDRFPLNSVYPGYHSTKHLYYLPELTRTYDTLRTYDTSFGRWRYFADCKYQSAHILYVNGQFVR